MNADRYWDMPWSLVDGCTPCSPGCDHCWSAGMTHRFLPDLTLKSHWIDMETGRTMSPAFNGKILTHPERLSIPLKRRKPAVYAVWNDLFHEKVPWTFQKEAYGVMLEPSNHTYLILTKRPGIMGEHLFKISIPDIPPNIWHGLTVCNQQEADEKIPMFLQVPGKKFLSLEPLLSKIDLTPYLSVCYNGIKEENNYAEKTREGNRCLSSGGERGLSDRRGRSCLASGQEGMGQVAKQSCEPPLQKGQGGTRCREVPSSTSPDQWEDAQLSSESIGISPLLRVDPSTLNSESQRRKEEKEPSGKSGIGNGFRTSPSCPSHFECREDGSKRSQECDGKVYSRSDSGNSGDEGRNSGRDGNPSRPQNINTGEEVRGELQRGLGYPQRKPLDLILLGGETGPGARPLHPDWIRSVRDQCAAAGVSFFFKGWGTGTQIPMHRGRLLDGRTHDDLPWRKT
jgi:protein gp37